MICGSGRVFLNLFQTKLVDREVDEELQEHIREAIEEGRDPDEVRNPEAQDQVAST